MLDRKFFGQNGEDRILWELFKHSTTPGVFLDVGALDGIHYSNTYSFELEGWTGICVEAHPTYSKICKDNRQNSIVINAAVHDVDKDFCKFYANHRGSLSTIDKSNEKYFKKYGKYFGGFTEIDVPMMTINTILDKNDIIKLDVVSIDIEGNELAALHGFNLRKYSPAILVIECMLKSKESALHALMKKYGYYYARKVSNNMFFCKTTVQAAVIAQTAPASKLQITKTIHPLDKKTD